MTQTAKLLDRLEGLISPILIGMWKGLDTETLVWRLYDQCDELIHFPGATDIRAKIAETCFTLMWGEGYSPADVFSNADGLLTSVSPDKGEDEYKRVLYGEIFKCWRLCDDEFVRHDINLAIVRRGDDVFLPGFLRNQHLKMPFAETWQLLNLARIGRTDVRDQTMVSEAFLKALVNKLMHGHGDGILIIADAVGAAYPYALPHLVGDHGEVRIGKMLERHRVRTTVHTEFLDGLLKEIESLGFDTVFHPRMQLITATENILTVEVNVSQVTMSDPSCGLADLRDHLQRWYDQYEYDEGKPAITVIPVDVVGKDGLIQRDMYGRIEGSFTLG